jgi:hypothetical protein
MLPVGPRATIRAVLAVQLEHQVAAFRRDTGLIEGVLQLGLVTQQKAQRLWPLHAYLDSRRAVGRVLQPNLHEPELGRVETNGQMLFASAGARGRNQYGRDLGGRCACW